MRLPTYCKNGSDMSFVGQEPAQNGQVGCKALEEKKTVRILDRGERREERERERVHFPISHFFHKGVLVL